MCISTFPVHIAILNLISLRVSVEEYKLCPFLSHQHVRYVLHDGLKLPTQPSVVHSLSC